MSKIAQLLMVVVFTVFGLFTDDALADKVSQTRLDEIHQLWGGSIHALADINCSSCHLDAQSKKVVIKPTYESCQECHKVAFETFILGKHGIRIAEGLTPLTPKMAHLPMKKSALSKQMNCNTCHDVHSVNTFQASVNSCLSCHNDPHSLNYEKSRHYELLLAEGSLPRPSTESVTCATCHLPRQDFAGVVHVNHNNTYNLLPRDRMVKDVCMNCHGMEYAYNSIFDDALVEENFARPPTQELKSLDMIKVLQKKKSS